MTSAIELQTEIRASADQRYGRRLHAVLLLEQGLSYPAVAGALGESPRTLARWVRRYRDHGLAGLRERAAGRPRRLTPEQLAEVRGMIGAPGKEWTAAALSAWISERFGVRLCDRQAGRLLRGVDCVVKSPGSTSGSTPPQNCPDAT